LTAPIIAAIFAIISFYGIRRYGFVFGPEIIARLFAAKLTFLSLILAAGFVQYGYFYQMRWTEGQRIRAGEWPHIKQARELLDEARTSNRTDAAFLKWQENTRRFLQDEPARLLRELSERNQPLFRNSLSILFALGGMSFASVTADLVWLLAPRDVEWLRYCSSATMIAAFATLAVGLVLTFVKIRVELIRFFDY